MNRIFRFFNVTSKNINLSKESSKIPYQFQWEIRDFKPKIFNKPSYQLSNSNQKPIIIHSTCKIPYEQQWETKDITINSKQI